MPPPIKIKTKVDYSGILAMARELAKYSPLAYEKIAVMETASIIKIAALRAKIAPLAKIKRDVLAKLDTGFKTPDGSIVSVNRHKGSGRTWFAPADRREDPKRPYRGKATCWFMVYAAGPARGHHLPDFYWGAFLLAIDDKTGYLKARVAELSRRRGMMRFSWIQMGDALGVPLSTVSPTGNLQEVIARGARSRGRIYPNGSAQIQITSRSINILIRNTSPLAIKNQGQAELDRAMAQRFKGFTIAMQKGMLTDLKARSARWRGVFVRAA